MKLYLDDDSASPLLAKLLGQAGHDVQSPADVGLSGEQTQFTFAMRPSMTGPLLPATIETS